MNSNQLTLILKKISDTNSSLADSIEYVKTIDGCSYRPKLYKNRYTDLNIIVDQAAELLIFELCNKNGSQENTMKYKESISIHIPYSMISSIKTTC